MPEQTVLERVQAFIRDNALVPDGGEITVLVSGGRDSTCLWHVLRRLGYRVSALHVNHGLRGEESGADARFCHEALGAEVVDGSGGTTEDELRRIRYGFATDRLRATGHTLSDQVETRRGSRPGARTASCGRCCVSGAATRAATARAKASPSARTPRTEAPSEA